MTTTNRSTLNIGDIDGATELVFSSFGTVNDVRYILQAARTDYLETLDRFPKFQIKRTTECYIDDCSGQWFAFANVDCFDPPFVIIRARSFEQAYEVFCAEFEVQIKVDDQSAEDYPEDERDCNGHGTHIDASGVQGWELQLLSVALV